MAYLISYTHPYSFKETPVGGARTIEDAKAFLESYAEERGGSLTDFEKDGDGFDAADAALFYQNDLHIFIIERA